MLHTDSESKRIRPIALAMAAALLLGACSSGSDSAASDGTDETTATTAETSTTEIDSGGSTDQGETSTESSDGDYDCQALLEHNATLRGASGWIPQVMAEESPEMLELFGDLDVVDAAIEGLRPIQDIDSVFGSPREGLDNMAADVAAIRAETYGEPAGDYKLVAVGIILDEEICQ